MKLWSNGILETESPKQKMREVFVHSLGLHHVTVFEDVVETVRVCIVAVTTFGGKVLFYELCGDGELKKLGLELQAKTTAASKDTATHKGNPDYAVYWAIEFLKDPLHKDHKFIATQTNGFTKIHGFSVEIDKARGLAQYGLQYNGLIEPKSPSFAMSLAVSPENFLVATGYSNGDIVISEVDKCRAVFTFNKPAITSEATGATLSSAIRALAFSPDGNILASAYDSGNYGNISLYDTKYGEIIGNLTTPTHSAASTIDINAHEGWIFAVDFNQDGDLLLSAGFDGKIRVWSLESREREATINNSVSDYADDEIANEQEGDLIGLLDAKFIRKGVRTATGSMTNDGIVCVGMDRGVRWFREAGGI